MEAKFMLWALSCVASIAGTLALLLIGWMKGRIDKTEAHVQRVEQKNADLAVAVSNAVTEARVRDILHEELSDIRRMIGGVDEKMTKLLLARMAIPMAPMPGQDQ